MGNKFGELHYREFDGIPPPTPGVLTLKETYRLVYGFPEVYITCIYRWREWPVVDYITENAIAIGKRLGKNTLIISIEGDEEQYWIDAKTIIQEAATRLGQNVELNDRRVYFLISGCNPQLLLDADSPFLLCDISELSTPEFLGFISKILDLFDVALELNYPPGKKRNEMPPTPGKILLSSQHLSQDEEKRVERALRIIAEITLVLESISIQLYGFDWSINDMLKSITNQIQLNTELYTKLMLTKDNLNKLKANQSINLTSGNSNKIKILFLAANPSGTTRIRLDKEIRSIQQALRQSEFRERFDLVQHWAVRATDIQDYLLQHRPDVVHFSGHGNRANEIILEDDTKDRNPISVRALSQLFHTLKDNIRCVLLNNCYSEAQAQAIAEHIDCVIGMSNAIGDNAAISFATAFYRAIGYGRDIFTAFELGCGLIDLENLNEQDTPKLIAKRCDPKQVVLVKKSFR